MSADKRTVSTDALETLGMKLGTNEKRDAIHLAVLPVKAGELLNRGDYIELKNGAAFKSSDGLGIVDPFIADEIQIGESFWMVLRPRIIKSLRHVWSHPDFNDEPFSGCEVVSIKKVLPEEKEWSERWLRSLCKDVGVEDYDLFIKEVLERDIENDRDDEYVYLACIDDGFDIPNEFWRHIENVTGEKIKHRPTHFSCSC